MPVIKQAGVIMGTGDVVIGFIESTWGGKDVQGISFTEISPIGCGESITDEVRAEKQRRYPVESITLGFTDPLAVRITIAALKKLLLRMDGEK